MIRRFLSKLRRAPARVPVPTVLQMEAVECGAASLAMVLAYHGKIVPLAELRRECGISRDGSKASNLVKAARRYGMVAKGFKKEPAALRAMACPFIVFWNFNHFLVVEGFGDDIVYFNDPALGRRTVSWKEFDESYTGVALVFEKGPDFQPGGRAPSVARALQRRLRTSWGPLLFCVLAGAILVVPGLLAPAFSKVFVDHVLVERKADWLKPLLTGIVFAAVLKALVQHLQLLYLRRLAVRLSTGMTGRFLWHLLRLPIGFYAQRYAGEIGNRVAINERVAAVLSGKLAQTAIDVVMLAFYGVVILCYDPVLGVVALGFVGTSLLALRFVAGRRIDAQQRLGQEIGKAEGVSIAGLQGMETIKSAAQEAGFFQRWAGYYTKALIASQEAGVSSMNLGVLPTYLTALSTLALLALGGLRVMEGRLTIGDLVALQSLMASLQSPVQNLVDLGSKLQDIRADLDRLDDVLDHEVDPRAEGAEIEAGTSQSALSRLEGHVELKGITFGYSRIYDPLVEGFSLALKPGQRVALVGGSGSGKSTVAKLVTGLYEPWAGEILFDGRKLAAVPRAVVASSIATVEQDIFLFAGSVRDNLTLWDETIPHDDVVAACRDAEIDEVVRAMPGGYEADLLEGAANLSGGQRQRLEIARALVGRPSILVMDEATSALDTETERRIDVNLRRRGYTCIIVAHRLSTIRDCDEIIVLKQGKVVQRGTHDSLYADLEGEYARLITVDGGAH